MSCNSVCVCVFEGDRDRQRERLTLGVFRETLETTLGM